MASEGDEKDDEQGAGGASGSADTAGTAGTVSAAAAADAARPAGGESVRVDSWIWSVRLVKTRSMGATACRGGHVRVNGERVKPAYAVRAGDEVRLRQAGGRERVVVVKRVIRKRVGAPVAAECYVDNSPPPPPREAVAPAGVRDRGAGRPTKRDRREMERLRGVGGPADSPEGP
ncbi:RNA-binding S4 domain-containing protein [Streptomyces sp. SAS_270]|uniref:RNA-binding S4 domain-containing protein n=1 Tax=Streptomyces sp. SAS_270 TaxID=3412748 RepID=UPI00403D0E4E